MLEELYECLSVDGPRVDHESLQTHILTHAADQGLCPHSDLEVLYLDALIRSCPGPSVEGVECEDGFV